MNPATKRTALIAGLAVVGVVLIAFAIVRMNGSFNQEVGVAGEEVTVECGNAREARNLDQVTFSDPDDFDLLESLSAAEVSSLTGDAADACKDEGTSRLFLSGVLGVLGLAALVVAVVLFLRQRAASGPEPGD